MTPDQLFTIASSAPPLAPAEHVGRWVLHRAGIVNVWQYDRAEIGFGGGRTLLRGKNGAGKSKALEVLLPFLFDGDTRSIDAAGRDRTTVYWLMTDGREPGNHVGYIWLELRHTSEDGDERFCTLGAGLKASPTTRQTATWFFLTEEARVGVDLHLGPEVSADGLRERLGSDAVTTASEHRRKVAARLFDLHDEARYANLLHLLHRLRDPNIGNKIEAGELAAVLRDALPPPSDEALEKAAERFDTLDQVRDQLERTQRTATALARFLDTYQGYARTVLRDRCHRVLDAAAERRKAERDATRRAEAASAAVAARQMAEAQVQRLRDKEMRAVWELEGLQASEDYKQHQNLVDRRRAVDAKDSAAGSAEQAAAELGKVAHEAAEDEQRALGHARSAQARVGEARPALVRLAREAGVDQAVVPTEAEGISIAVTVADGRRRAAAQVRRLAEVAAEAKALADRADERAARSEQELTGRQTDADYAFDAWVTDSRAWRSAVRAWLADDLAGRDGPAPDWRPLHGALGEGAADAEELTEVPAVMRSLVAPLQEAARNAESTARSTLTDAERLLGDKEAERAVVEAAEESRPPASRFRGAERDERAGAPFYELVDLAVGLAAADRAGLEAALEASGLLDAWVGNDGLVVHPSTQDVILRADAPALPAGTPTLADVLVTARPDVGHLLRTVGLGDQGSQPWVCVDGRWSIGPMRGAWSKVEAEYLGAGTRRATRQRRLTELVRQCAELRADVDMAGARLADRRETRQRLDRLPATFPSDSSVRGAASRADALAGVAGDARARYDVDRRSAEQARTGAARAASELARTAALDSLPVSLASLDAVAVAAAELSAGLRAWRTAWDEWAERQVVAAAAATRHAERVAAADGAATRAAARRQDHDAEAASLTSLEEAVGATVNELLAGIADCTEQRDGARRKLPAASGRAQELAVAEGRALELTATTAARVVAAADAVVSAAERLGRAVVLPGVGAAALGAEPDWEATDAVAAATALRAQVGDGGAVSDQVVLNRLRELEDGLAGGYDVVFGEEDGVKFFHVADDTGRQPLPTVAARVAAEAAAAKERLAANERDVIERFLLGELGEELRERLLESHDLVRAANGALGGVRTSHGKGARIEWRIDQEAPAVARSTAELLVMAPRSAEEDARLRDALMELIRAQREKDPALGYLEHLREALDFRRWYRFTVQVVDDARPGSTRALSSRLGLSQGEQRVLSYLALFAAASAHYDGLGPSCPRLLLLDDAFAKVDEPTHGRLLSLLVDLNLDFLITSERMWGCFSTVPSLEIYEALREPSVPGVALVHFRWDGQQRHLVGI